MDYTPLASQLYKAVASGIDDLGSVLNNSEFKSAILEATNLFMKEPTLLKLHGPVFVVGDTHGDIQALLNIFQQNGYPPENTYLFLGDYIDRGQNSIAVLALLYLIKIRYQDSIFLLRGNHETNTLAKQSFRNSCPDFYSYFITSFQYLPLAAIIDEEIFCVHGGISPHIDLLADIDRIQKPIKKIQGPIRDFLWNDPKEQQHGFQSNSSRGIGLTFGENELELFLRMNHIRQMIRGHTFYPEGFSWSFKGKCLTLSSNNNSDAISAIAQVQDGKITQILTYEQPGRIIFPEVVLQQFQYEEVLDDVLLQEIVNNSSCL